MDSDSRLQHILTLFKPFHELQDWHQKSIKRNKLKFPDPDDKTLKAHLTKLGVPQLADYLCWIPYCQFTEVKELGRGGFARVYKGTIELLDPPGFPWVDLDDLTRINHLQGTTHYALKEIGLSMIPEVSICTSNFLFFFKKKKLN